MKRDPLCLETSEDAGARKKDGLCWTMKAVCSLENVARLGAGAGKRVSERRRKRQLKFAFVRVGA